MTVFCVPGDPDLPWHPILPSCSHLEPLKLKQNHLQLEPLRKMVSTPGFVPTHPVPRTCALAAGGDSEILTKGIVQTLKPASD